MWIYFHLCVFILSNNKDFVYSIMIKANVLFYHHIIYFNCDQFVIFICLLHMLFLRYKLSIYNAFRHSSDKKLACQMFLKLLRGTIIKLWWIYVYVHHLVSYNYCITTMIFSFKLSLTIILPSIDHSSSWIEKRACMHAYIP